MADNTPSIDASKRELWEAMAQVNLRKKLVSTEVCATTFTINGADKIHKPYFTELAAGTYTPGEEFALQDASSTDDSITVDTKKYCAFYIDEVEETQSYYNTMDEMASSAGYQLADTIDQAVFAQVDNGTEFDDGDIAGTDGSAIVLATSNVISLFVGMRKKLAQLNVIDANDFVVVLSPAATAIINQTSTGLGFNFADAAVNNGKVGRFMGFDIYESNNLTTGTYGGTANTTYCYGGKRGMIQLIMLADVRLKIVDIDNKIGKAVQYWTAYGTGVWTRDKSRFLDCKIYAA